MGNIAAIIILLIIVHNIPAKDGPAIVAARFAAYAIIITFFAIGPFILLLFIPYILVSFAHIFIHGNAGKSCPDKRIFLLSNILFVTAFLLQLDIDVGCDCGYAVILSIISGIFTEHCTFPRHEDILSCININTFPLSAFYFVIYFDISLFVPVFISWIYLAAWRPQKPWPRISIYLIGGGVIFCLILAAPWVWGMFYP
jgi:hypothetical protein